MESSMNKINRKLNNRVYTCKNHLASIALLNDKYIMAAAGEQEALKKYDEVVALMENEAKQQTALMKEATQKIHTLQDEKADLIMELNVANELVREKSITNAKRIKRIADLEKELRVSRNNTKLLLFALCMQALLYVIIK